ncbi:MAG: PAS domain S-box protein [Gammaproteobacteria bacterium]|nr:PAS domain S-box protein [Gammaproteobacteria bacterium]
MKLNLPVKTALLAFVIAGTGVMSIAWLSYQDASRLLREQSLIHLSDELRRESALLAKNIETLREDARFLEENDATKGLVRAILGNGYDERENATAEQWRRQLERTIQTVLRQRTVYFKIRLIDASGREIIKVERKAGKLVSYADEGLQQKAHRPYFQYAIKLSTGQHYLSEITLNRENKRIFYPPQPTLRIAVPIFTDSSRIFGILIISMDFNLLTYSLQDTPKDIYFFVANYKGEYLYHPDPDKRMAFEFGKRANVEEDFLLLNAAADADDHSFRKEYGSLIGDFKKVDLADKNLGMVSHHLHFDPQDRKRFLIVGAVASYTAIEAESKHFGQQLLIRVILEVIFLSVAVALLARYLTRPIRALTLVADRITKGEKNVIVPDFGGDEVGVLAASLRTMLNYQEESRTGLRTLANSLGIQVEERTKALSIRKNAIESALNGIIIADMDGKISYVNPAFVRMLGYQNRKQLQRHDLFALWGNQAAIQDARAALLKEGLWLGELNAVRRDGIEVVIELSASLIEEGGKDVGIVISIQDNTKRKRAEDEIRQLNAELEQRVEKRTRALQHEIMERKRGEEEIQKLNRRNSLILSAAGEGIYGLDLQGYTTFLNPAAARMIGWKQEELLGKPQHDISHHTKPDGSPYPREECPIYATFRDGAARHVSDEVFWRKDGSSFPVDYMSSPIEQDGRVVGTVVVFRDISARKEAEKKLQNYQKELEKTVAERTAELCETNEEIKTFAYIVSHDLRAPLVNLKGFVGELRYSLDEIQSITDAVLPQLQESQRMRLKQLFDEDITEAMTFIDSSTSKMDELINAVLKLSRLGRRELEIEEVDMDRLAEEVLNTLAYQIETAGAEVSLQALPSVTADRAAMEQIFGNILNNAIKYLVPGRPGGIQISGEQTAHKTVFHIRDNGRGIAEADIPKIFELFRRAGKQDVAGEGMGLAYVKTLLRRHNGTIACESKSGEGSVFSFSLPKQAVRGNPGAVNENAS